MDRVIDESAGEVVQEPCERACIERLPIYYLTGVDRPGAGANGLGLLVTPATQQYHRYVPDYRVFAIDNGCFAGDFDEMTFWTLVRRAYGHLRHHSFPLFATAPDVVGNALATKRRAWTSLHHIRNWGIPAAFVAQDGLEDTGWAHQSWFWDEFDTLFIGGSTAWKLSPAAAGLVAEARSRRKWVHMGRVNSLKRLRYAAEIGCLSADGTYLAFGPDKNMPKLLTWVDVVNTMPAQITLPWAV